MKRIISWLLVALLLCSALGVSALAADDELVGTWYMVDMDDGSGKSNAETIATMSALGLYATLEIRADGTATINLFDETHDFTVDFQAKTFLIGDDGISYTLEDGILSFGDEEMHLSFSRETPSASSKAGEQPFTYYEFIDMKDSDGEYSDIPAELVNMVIFDDGNAVMTSGSTVLEMTFDFDKNEIFSDEDGKIGEFTLEDDVLTIDDGEYIIRFRPGDPGCVGPYVLTSLIDSDGKELSDELNALAMLNMLPTLTIDEEGVGILDLMGEETKLFFDFDKMVVSAEDDDEAIGFTYENGTLIMESDGNSMTFRRVMVESDAEEAEAVEEAPAEEKSHSDKG